MSLDLRVVILTYGSSGTHADLLRSLAAEDVPAERVVIVHNPSRPGEEPSVPAGIEVLLASHNLGYAAGMNLGIERQLQRGCELLLVLTHDARFRPGGLGELLAAAAAHPEQGVLGPVLLFAGSEEPFSYGGVTGSRGEVIHRREPGPDSDGVSPCDWVDGGTMLFRAEALRRVGGFDERLWSYFEDAEICLRVARAGFGVGVALAARADQEPGMEKRLGPWAYLMARNRLLYASAFAGRRGAVRATAIALRLALVEAGRALLRAVRLRAGRPGERWAVAVGSARGVSAFYRHRWGPPPAGLPGGGDIANVQPFQG